ncbi:aspartate ammonia-lyase [Anaerotalea alkaliphila]|uniref:Aspartate ammonia-lyase n=1 Tax=Anaerotalea alkaliphila TaxID=2662126 RepID=A0A7X5KND7_9FIRM|nr:aspartate ammonia-lyase [Anaerotalea alkaliphila]NDL68764.1 aspartate ammonia-lyase [Anaerotalea alkaliphila]
MMEQRIESDALGTLAVPREAWHGIHTQRALEHSSLTGDRVHPALVKALVLVKQAAAMVNGKLGLLPPEVAKAVSDACDKVLTEDWRHAFPLHPLQGGAGTSTNMNVNEVLANLAIHLLGGEKGDYGLVHPLRHVNCSQSTNDVYPTAMRIAAIQQIRSLADALARLQESLQAKEAAFDRVLKLGRTQYMDAVPVTLGQEFGAYARAVGRDRWRIYKVEERLREVNIGGTAVGTGLNAPVEYIYRMTDTLQQVTGLGLARSDYLMDTTQNMDVFVEVSGLLKSCAVNLVKVANDLRLLASGPRGGLGEIRLKPLQAGSSIMPGKVNPVQCEMIVQVGYTVMGNDLKITQAASAGVLELNPFGPLIIHSLLESLELLTQGVERFRVHCIEPLEADEARCRKLLDRSYAMATALSGHLGYDRASLLAKEALEQDVSLEALAVSQGLLTADEAAAICNVHEVTKPGIPGRRKP